ncbi:MAG: hypothetical protein WCR30_02160 [Clostridia bacterium]
MNIAIVCHERNLLKDVAYKVALALGMFFVDASDFIEYDLVDKERATNFCSKDYLEVREKKAIENICSYENTLISITDELFVSSQNFENVRKQRAIFFLKTDKKFSLKAEKIVSKLGEEARENEIANISDFVILQDKKTNEVLCKEIVGKMNEYKGVRNDK